MKLLIVTGVVFSIANSGTKARILFKRGACQSMADCWDQLNLPSNQFDLQPIQPNVQPQIIETNLASNQAILTPLQQSLPLDNLIIPLDNPNLPSVQPEKTVRQQLKIHGYIKGKSFLKKSVVFKCLHKVTNIEYVCKIQTVEDIDEKPTEAQVFDIIKANNLKSFATMHELIDLGIVDNKRMFVEVIDYLRHDMGWSNLDAFKEDYPEKLTNVAILFIFKQIIEAVIQLFEHGITHSDLKGITVYFDIRVKRND
jgi:hypothetical protein